MVIEVDDTVFIPIHTAGTNVLFETRLPTEKEIQECPRLNLTGKNEKNPTIVLLGSTALINRIKTEPSFKEQLLTLLTRKIAQTTRFDDALEDLPTRHNYSSTKRHTNISAEVIDGQFGIVFKR